MPKINSLSFTELRSELLESLKDKCEHDQSYAKVWQAVVRRDPSHSLSSVDEAATLSSTLSSDELN